LSAWKTSRIAKLANLKRAGKIGTRLHSKAVKATVNLRSLDEGIALAFSAFSGDEEAADLVVTLHSLLASDPAIDPSQY
jgi:hypothetical protein